MNRLRAELRTEIRTRLRDEVYARLQDYKRLNFIDNDSAAVAALIEILLCGIVPAARTEVSDSKRQDVARYRV